MSSVIRSRKRYQARALAVCSGVIISAGVIAGCATEFDDEEEVAFAATEQAVTLAAVGDPLPGVTAAAFAEAKAAFAAEEELDEGLGPVFNEAGCGVCHTQGAIGGAGVQIERRFGRFDSFGHFDDLANKGGSLRQLRTVGSFIGLNGQSCTV
ncbi:MAG TPA: hypothetical protein VK601_12425, partial [Kofleriaceae bacterium]|nr:hypothetical protein [Kofleriaceae bacterium]